MSQTVFLSCVTSEFGTLRPKLARMVQRTRLGVRHQDDFPHRGVLTLQKLEEEVCASNAVFHVLGARAGFKAPAAQVEDFLTRHPGFDRFPEITADGRKGEITYTQWEAWFALFFDKRLCVYQVEPTPRVPLDPSLKTHLARLKERQVHPQAVADEQGLLEEIRISLIHLHLLAKQDLETRPCNLPYNPLGELFIGRGPFLEDIRRRFEEARRQHPGAWPNHAVTGMAGVGKTRVAIEYAWKHQQDYRALLFVSGETPASLDSHLANLAGVLQLGLPTNTADPEKRAAVLAWLKKNPEWLLIVDNVDDQRARDAVNSLLKDWHCGHVLITGRYLDWGKDVDRLGLQVLSQKDAADFLQKSTPERQQQPDDATAALDLATELGGLCLVLEQCSAYVHRLGLSLAEYGRRWQANFKNVRAWADRVLMKYHEDKPASRSVATTWRTTLQHLTPLAKQLLHVLCWLAPEPIPRTFLDALDKQKRLAGDLEEAAGELRSHSLLQRPLQCGFNTFGEINRVVQLITREALAVEESELCLLLALGALHDAFTGDPTDVESWPLLNPLAAHVREAVHHADAARVAAPTTRLMNDLALLYKCQGRFAEAEVLHRRALAIDERLLGKHHPTIAIRLNNLAQLLQRWKPQGTKNRLEEAELLARRALTIDEQVYGKNDPKVAVRLNNLAALLCRLDRLNEAETHMRRALAIDEVSLGKYDAQVAVCLNNLAKLLHRTNRLEEAESLLLRALEIDKQSPGADRCSVARDLNNLAVLLKPLIRRHLEIFVDLARARGYADPQLRGAFRIYVRLLRELGRSEQEIRAELGAIAEAHGLSFDD